MVSETHLLREETLDVKLLQLKLQMSFVHSAVVALIGSARRANAVQSLVLNSKLEELAIAVGKAKKAIE